MHRNLNLIDVFKSFPPIFCCKNRFRHSGERVPKKVSQGAVRLVERLSSTKHRQKELTEEQKQEIKAPHPSLVFASPCNIQMHFFMCILLHSAS